MEGKRRLRVLYAGSPLASAMVLERLAAAGEGGGWEIAAVLTNPPSPRGRHRELVPTEVAAAAGRLGIPVLAFDHIRAEARGAAESVGADLLVSFDYGRIFGPKFLGVFPLGGINLHPGALPRYRGCTPVPSAILSGDEKIVVCVQRLALATDEGDILATGEIPLSGEETTLSLMDGDGTSSPVSEVGAGLLAEILRAAASAEPFALPASVPQSGGAGYTPFLRKEDGEIDWGMGADEIGRRIRAFTPWPGCFTSLGGVRLRIISARPVHAEADEGVPAGTVVGSSKAAGSEGIHIRCGSGVLAATELQWEKKKAADWRSFLNGSRGFVGSVLGK